MYACDVTAEQSDRLFLRVSRDLAYLHKLIVRMQEVGFPPDDPLYRSTRQAVPTMRELYHRANDGRRRRGYREALRRAEQWPSV